MSAAVQTYLTGLVGRGIGGSLSREIHELEAIACGLSLVYRILDFDVIGYGDGRLSELLTLLASIGFAGFNVTHPYKQRIMTDLGQMSPDAAALGAVNTVVRHGGIWSGFNTDWSGFRGSLLRNLPEAELGEVANIGCGGAGAATAYALLSLGTSRLRLFDRDRSRAERLGERLDASFPRQSLRIADSVEACVADVDGVVQATPIGMTSHPGLPFDPRLLRPNMWVADIIYFPRETELLRAARQLGCRTMSGAGMVVQQAADAFHLFTGVRPDSDRMRAILEPTPC